jgi:tetratricopeptide (TPR) repeat protein
VVGEEYHAYCLWAKLQVQHCAVILGAAALFLGRYEGVRAQAETSLAAARETGHLRGVGNACLLLGQVALAREAYAEAHDWWQEGATLLRETGPREELALALAFQAYAARGFGALGEARRYLHEALQIATELPMALSVLVAVPGMALLVATQGEIERAVELYALALRHSFVANSPWFEDVAGRQIAAAAAELPPEAVAAAQARGRARDLEATVMELLEELGG